MIQGAKSFFGMGNMSTILRQFEEKKIAETGRSASPEFRPGDTLSVKIKITEGAKERTQVFEGVCIARRGTSIGKSFTVRKISDGVGVERVFPLYSPLIVSISVVKRGRVRRAKLYYLRQRSGKSARIAERKVSKPLSSTD